MTADDNVSDSVKLAAIRDALDRGGLGVKTEIELSARPYETNHLRRDGKVKSLGVV